jgi:hypothetical protein
VSHEVIVTLIAHTATQQGLLIQAELDSGMYPTGLKVSAEELALVNLIPAGFHGDWNYTIPLSLLSFHVVSTTVHFPGFSRS